MMKRENKKESVAKLHKQNILNAAEPLFITQGFDNTTIENISKASGYSRRTIYAYFADKDDILYHIILKGLITLEEQLKDAIATDNNFLDQYRSICKAMTEYHATSPISFEAVNQIQSKNIQLENIPGIVTDILRIGEEINHILEEYIDAGIKHGVVRADVKTKQTVFILWSSISALLGLVQNKGSYIETAMGVTKEEFLDYGFNQIINSILEKAK